MSNTSAIAANAGPLEAIPLSAEARTDSPPQPMAAEVATISPLELQIWYYSSNAVLHPISVCNELHLLTEGRMKELAVSTMQAGVPQACNILSPEAGWLVALPIAEAPLGCLLAIHHGPPDTNPVQSIVRGLVPVQQLALRFAKQCIPSPATDATVHATRVEVEEPRSNLSWPELLGCVAHKLRRSFGNRSTWVITCAVAITLGIIGIVPIPYRIRCDVVCEPSTRRFVAAPFDSTLTKAFVSVGQQVKAGELLATLDGRELRSRLAALQAEYAQEIQQKLASLRIRGHAEAELARLRAEKLAYDIEVIEQKLDSLEIRSPLDGIIVSGDLERVEGVPVKLGETLFEIGHLDDMIAELHVPEEQVSDVALGCDVVVTLDSFGGQPFRTTVETLHPRSELIGNASVFIAEARLPSAAFDLKPGMHGTATIAAGYRSAAWHLLHRPYYRLRQFLGW